MPENKVVKEGTFSVEATKPDGTKEEFERANRKLEIGPGGAVIVTRKGYADSTTVTVLPPGTTVVAKN